MEWSFMNRPFKKIWIALPVLLLLSGLFIGCGKDGNMKAVTGGDRPIVPGHGYPPGQGSQLVWLSELSIVDKSAYRKFLGEFGLQCNQFSWINIGISNCKAWDRRAAIQLMLSSPKVPAYGEATVFVYPDGYFNLYYPGAPIRISGAFEPSHADTKFELRRIGYTNTYSYDAVLRVVATGQPTDNQLQVEVYYRGLVFGRAVVNRIH